MMLNSRTLAVLLVVIMFGGILGSSALGWWQTTSSKVPVSFAEGEFAGQANPADIRGSYTFGDVSQSFAVTPEILAQAFGAGTDAPAGFQIKELETIYADSGFEIGTASVRLFVALYCGLPYDLTTAAETFLPQSATDLLLARGNLSEDQLDFLKTHTVVVGASPEIVPQLTNVPVPTAVVGTTLLVKGKTTFGELTGWGVPQPVIEQIIGAAMPAPAMALKDYASANGLDFESIKTALQAEVDKLKK